jgi:hypothetical protein
MNTAEAIEFYRSAKDTVKNSQFCNELDWQISRNINSFTESELLRETAWVILYSGFRESVIRSHFAFITTCFCNWESSQSICESQNLCRTTALSSFRNERKIDARLNTAAYIRERGFEEYKTEIIRDPLPALSRLPFIGKITANHLPKNLGCDVAKADRHLQRFASSLGYRHPQEICSLISNAPGDPIRVVDLVLWRFFEQQKVRERSSCPADC